MFRLMALGWSEGELLNPNPCQEGWACHGADNDQEARAQSKMPQATSDPISSWMTCVFAVVVCQLLINAGMRQSDHCKCSSQGYVK